jgi:phosphatidylserine decarboxylase
MILREGVIPISATGFLAAVVHGALGAFAALPLWLALVWFTWLYWEWRPPLPSDPNAILSPVDGRVLAVGEARDPWLERDALRITIATAFPGVLPLRSPTEGKVMDLYTRRGVFGEAQHECAPGESPDCYGQWVRTDEGDDVAYALSSRFALSRARFDIAPGERVGQGARSGFIYFASVSDVLAPHGSTARVSVGDRVDAGESVLAHLPKR